MENECGSRNDSPSKFVLILESWKGNLTTLRGQSYLPLTPNGEVADDPDFLNRGYMTPTVHRLLAVVPPAYLPSECLSPSVLCSSLL
jgi:hypothetical protein